MRIFLPLYLDAHMVACMLIATLWSACAWADASSEWSGQFEIVRDSQKVQSLVLRSTPCWSVQRPRQPPCWSAQRPLKQLCESAQQQMWTTGWTAPAKSCAICLLVGIGLRFLRLFVEIKLTPASRPHFSPFVHNWLVLRCAVHVTDGTP